MLKRTTLKLFAALAFMAALGLGSRPIGAQDAAQSFRFVPAEAIAAIVAYPRRALDGPGTELYPREIISAAVMKELGIDPLEIDQLVAFVESPNDPGPPPFGIVLRMSKPQDRQTLLPPLMQGATAATLSSGRPFFRAAQPMLPSVMLPNDRTIVIAPEASLEKMTKAAAANADSPLLKLLRAAPVDRQLILIATLDPIRGQIQGAMAQTPQLPPPLERFKQLPELVSSVEIRANMTGELQTELILRSPDASSATQVQDLLANAIAFGKEAFLAQAMQAPRSAPNDPVQQATARYVQRLAEHFSQMLQPKLEANTVTVAVKMDSGAVTSGVALGLLMPAVQAARSAGQRSSASNNLKQIGVAMHNYHDTYSSFPAPAIADANGKPLLSWRVAILPFVEQGALYRQFKLDEPWDSETNRALIAKMPSVYLRPGTPNEGKTLYLLPTGKSALFSTDKPMRISGITDGTSNTVMAVEAAPDRAVIWTKPDDLPFNPERPLDGLIGPGGTFFQALFADGSVRVISANTDNAVLKAIFSPQGGEAVPIP